MKNFAATAAIVLAPLTASQLVWPSEWDELEEIYTMQSGYNRRGFIDAVNPCSFGTFVKGRHNAAEWIRTAFHDMATHDAEMGTGGLDASIFFELDRPENAGSAFENTFGFFSGYHTIRTSASDLIALGVIAASAMCDGPPIKLRAGRKDADRAGVAGVPEPQTDLHTTLATFNKAGFSQEDMITMVACGHALGGVHSVNFPDIVEIPADPENDTSVPFQQDNSRFHNGVITEFLGNTTKNPLVVASNDTMNSDKRIFESDNRKTMRQLADPATFKTMCGDVFSRMIDTVPGHISLTDVIEPYDVKPSISELSVNDNGDLNFRGLVRLRTTRGLRNATDVNVTLRYVDRNGNGETVVPVPQVKFQGGSTTGLNGENFVNYEFNTTIKGESGISKFWIDEMIVSTNKSVTHDNIGTGGYPVQDFVLHQLPQSCRGNFIDGKFPSTIAAMVRKERVTGPITLTMIQEVPRQGVVVPELRPEIVEFKATGESNNGWLAYEAHVDILRNAFTTFDIAVKGEKPVTLEFQRTGNLKSCGTAGCNVAARLAAAEPNLIVLVIGSGPNGAGNPIIDYATLFLANLVPSSTTISFYKSNASDSVAGRKVVVPIANVSGSGSSVNMMMYNRAQRLDWDPWKTRGWSADEILPFVRKLETYEGPGTMDTHGSDGPIHVSTETFHSARARDAFVAAMGKLGWPEIEDINNLGACNGVGSHYDDHQLLLSAYKSCLEPDETMDGILTGALNPADLITSSYKTLGWNAQYATYKIRPTEIDSIQLGPHFQEAWDRDYQISLENLLGFQRVSILACPPSVYPYSRGHVHITGPELTDVLDFDSGLFPDAKGIDILKHRWAYKRQREAARRMNVFRGELAMAHPPFPAESRAVCKDSDGPPGDDVQDIVYSAEDDAIIDQWLRHNVGSAWHSLGTCRMAPKEEGGVVDENLSVHGIEGPKIADLSIVPKNVASNTNHRALVIGENAADILIKELEL
ncbi:WSC domain-containing protein [Paramyrothecium foliicola]|nr:WSC domain-containing protein [Paramyrothecium foliicola]